MFRRCAVARKAVPVGAAPEFYNAFEYSRMTSVSVPELCVDLFPFQKEGIGWMANRERTSRGGILADHLGLGKTVQMIGLCLVADKVQAASGFDESDDSLAFRLLAVLRQLSQMTAVVTCSKINQPARDIKMLVSSIQSSLRDRSALSTLCGEVLQWVAFVGRLYSVYAERAKAFLEEGLNASSSAKQDFEKVDAQVLRTLVVVPAALLFQWKSEIESKVSKERNVSCYLYYGTGRAVSASVLENFDFVITTYDTVVSSAARELKGASHGNNNLSLSRCGPLFSVTWKRVILDEAHVIRHSSTLRWKAVSMLRSTKRWAITATPLHNSIDDLQNLLAFTGNALLPVPPKSQSQDILEDQVLQRAVAKALQPALLRRAPVVVRDGVQHTLVALPEKTEEVMFRHLSGPESERYNSILSHSRGVIEQQSASHHHTAHIFSLMTKLRLSCCHPWLADATGVQVFVCGICKSEAVQCVTTKCAHTFCFECLLQKFREANDGDTEASKIPCPECELQVSLSLLRKKGQSPAQRHASIMSRELERSTKLDMLMESVRRVTDHSKDKVIIFSHFTSFLDVVELLFKVENIEFFRLDGTMTLSARNAVIRSFQATDNVRVMIASKTATGVGLNLTAANHVIVVDPWWNPAIEEQAVHRCHRIGQTKAVRVSRFIISDTIEHYCFEIARRKKDFGDAILKAAASDEGRVSAHKKIHELISKLNFVGV